MVEFRVKSENRDGRFSTVDISIVDLYSGMCHFLKAGAATTFIKRSHWVEAISSTSLALGLVQQADFESSTKKLYEGDFLIMVTDGVLDALPGRGTGRDYEGNYNGSEYYCSPGTGERGILERVLTYCEYRGHRRYDGAGQQVYGGNRYKKMKIEEKVFSYIEEYKMIETGSQVLLGISGGADSVCLLFLLKEYQKRKDFSLRGMHINHGIRGKEAVRDQEFTRDLCERLEVPLGCPVLSGA